MAKRRAPAAPVPEIAQVRGACLRDHGGDGPPAVLIPSLINPPHILDLDPDVSLARTVARMGRRCLLLDWGRASERAELDVAGHVESVLLPFLRKVGGAPSLIGYCLGGTMAIAAANLIECERVVTLATPWNFAAYPERSLTSIRDMWRHAKRTAEDLGALPMEVLQASFWSLDPERTVSKFAEFGRLDPASAEAARFVELEDWANEGEPLPFPAARELMEDIFGEDRPGTSTWTVGGKMVSDALDVPTLNVLAANDRIAPASTAPAGTSIALPSGHVGMIVGSARTQLHAELARFLSNE